MFQIVDRFGIVTINSQWKRIFEIMKSRPLLFNTVNSCGVLVQINAVGHRSSIMM